MIRLYSDTIGLFCIAFKDTLHYLSQDSIRGFTYTWTVPLGGSYIKELPSTRELLLKMVHYNDYDSEADLETI